jgi:hypothetical protein
MTLVLKLWRGNMNDNLHLYSRPSRDEIRTAIKHSWKSYDEYGHSEVEKTALILNSLYQMLANHPVLLKEAYTTLLPLVTEQELKDRLNKLLKEMKDV